MHKMTKLGTKLCFNVYDFRGQHDFPLDERGFVYEHFEKRTIQCKYTGVDIHRDARYFIRTDATGLWRIDLRPKIGPSEAVYAVSGQGHFGTKEAAAQALAELLDEIKTNSSVA